MIIGREGAGSDEPHSGVSQALHVAAKLGIADLLADGPVDCEDLAAATDTHAPALQRLLRALASVGVFTQVSPGSFALLGKWLDLHMLVLLGGRERATAEYDTLFRVAGFKLARVVPTPSGPSVLEAVPF